MRLFFLRIPHETDLPARLVSLFLPLSILPVLASCCLSLLLLFKKDAPLWALLIAYVLEAALLTVALYFSAPLMIVVLSVVLLGERVSALRWLAVAIGFLGVLVILRPDAAPIDLAAILAITSGT